MPRPVRAAFWRRSLVRASFQGEAGSWVGSSVRAGTAGLAAAPAPPDATGGSGAVMGRLPTT
ncbi:hypothetical protein GCM10010193_47660 [Kitasatospora atroaurantiaca]